MGKVSAATRIVCLLGLMIISSILQAGVGHQVTTGDKWIGMVTITMDDGWREQYENVYPILREAGIPATLFVTIGQSQLSLQELHVLQDSGWEIGSHGLSHLHMTSLDKGTLQNELQGSKEWLVRNGIVVQTLAYPNGETNETVTAEASKIYVAGRLAFYNGTIYTPRDFSPLYFNLSPFTMENRTTNWIIKLIDQTILAGGWTIFFFHTTDKSGKVNRSQVDLRMVADYIRQKFSQNLLMPVTFIHGYQKWREAAIGRGPEWSFSFIARDNQQFNMSFDQVTVRGVEMRLGGLTLRNLIFNPSFENWSNSAPVGWSKLHPEGTIGLEQSEDALFGTYSVMVSVNSTYGFSQRGIGQTMPVKAAGLSPGDCVFLSMYIKNVRDVVKARIGILFLLDTTPQRTSFYSTIAVLRDRFDVVDLICRMPDDAVELRLQADAISFSTGAHTGIFTVDGAVLVKGIDEPDFAVPVFFEGDSETRDLQVKVNNETFIYQGSANAHNLLRLGNPIHLAAKFFVGGNGIVEVTITCEVVCVMRYGRVQYDQKLGVFLIAEMYEGYTEVKMLQETPIELVSDLTYSSANNIKMYVPWTDTYNWIELENGSILHNLPVQNNIVEIRLDKETKFKPYHGIFVSKDFYFWLTGKAQIQSWEVSKSSFEQHHSISVVHAANGVIGKITMEKSWPTTILRIRLDSQEVENYKVDSLGRITFDIPPGDHRVEFLLVQDSQRPEDFLSSSLGLAVIIGVVSGSLILFYRRTRRRTSET